MRQLRIALVGATGLVGRKMLEVLAEREFPVGELIPVGSPRSYGKKVSFVDREYEVVSVQDAVSAKPDLALFSAGSGVSLEWAPRFAEVGTFVVDNSSAWRMDEGTPLVVPEVNPDALSADSRIIANPNCSTIQMVVALAPLHAKWNISRLVISTYQSVTGTGKDAVEQFEGERKGQEVSRVYPHPIDKNCLPHCDVFYDDGYTKEELKLVNETRKILSDDTIRITATAVRVPVVGGHSESVNVEFGQPVSAADVRQVLSASPGVTVQDDPERNLYPMPLSAYDTDDVYVGRIRDDHSHPNAVNLWIVSDNIRKGAATNAVQIAEKLVERGFLSVL